MVVQMILLKEKHLLIKVIPDITGMVRLYQQVMDLVLLKVVIALTLLMELLVVDLLDLIVEPLTPLLVIM